MTDDSGRMVGARVLIVHDWLVAWGGAERTLEQLMVLFPEADVIAGVISDRTRPLNDVTRRARETWLGKVPLARTHHRWFLPLYALAFASVNTKGYDIVISGAHAFAKAVRASDGAPHICYCYSPPRYIWDLGEAYRRNGTASGLALTLMAPLLRVIDRYSARGVDQFIGISHYIADRIKRAYGREASVVYPPVSAKPAPRGSGPRNNSFLALGRLVPYKRVDLAILAANAIGAPLLVAGDGPERARLERLAGPTVTFLGEVSEERAGELMETSRAMLFCAEEDFGIPPVEANAHGLPVVAFGKGALLESMVEGVTAVFFRELELRALTAAMEQASHTVWDEEVIRANAARFTAERFRQGIAAEVRRALDAGQNPVRMSTPTAD